MMVSIIPVYSAGLFNNVLVSCSGVTRFLLFKFADRIGCGCDLVTFNYFL